MKWTVSMMKPAFFVLSALSLSACVGTSTEPALQDVNLSKIETMATCPGLTGVSAEYSRSTGGLPYRCGPQTQSPITYQ